MRIITCIFYDSIQGFAECYVGKTGLSINTCAPMYLQDETSNLYMLQMTLENMNSRCI